MLTIFAFVCSQGRNIVHVIRPDKKGIADSTTRTAVHIAGQYGAYAETNCDRPPGHVKHGSIAVSFRDTSSMNRSIRGEGIPVGLCEEV